MRTTLPLCLTLVLAAVVAAQAPPPQPSPEARATPAGPSFEPCSGCHEEVTTAFVSNPHARLEPRQEAVREATRPEAASGAAQATTVCEACHGDGTRHAEEGDPALIHVPEAVSDDAICMACHGALDTHLEVRLTGLRSEPHPAAGVACVDCHDIHQPASPLPSLLSAHVDELCATCHQAERAAFRRPFAHRLGRGGLSCVSCHDPHSRGTREGSLEASLSPDASPCAQCHPEARGPFVFEHVSGITGECTSCHEPHGSTNPKRLIRSQMHQLCLECHSNLGADTLGSQPPSFHDLRSPRFRECTLCHVAVHGSNTSPALLK